MVHEPDETQEHQGQRPQGTDQRLPGGFNGLGFALLIARQPPPVLAEGRQERATDAEHDDDSHDNIERCR